MWWVYNGDCTKLIGDGEPFRADDGTSYPGNWDKATVSKMQQVALTPQPDRPGFRVTGNRVEMIGGVPTRVWIEEAVPVEPLNPNAAALQSIIVLENKITSRRLREAVLGIDGGWLASVEAEIAALRSGLA
jgi:hypothetical protein